MSYTARIQSQNLDILGNIEILSRTRPGYGHPNHGRIYFSFSEIGERYKLWQQHVVTVLKHVLIKLSIS